MTNSAAVDSPSITNRSSDDEKKIITRLILQKIISSDVSQYMRRDSYDRLSRMIISERVDDEITLNFRTQENRESYYSSISDMTIKWLKGDNEINDLDGNVWVSYRLSVAANINSCYSLDPKALAERVDCLWNLNDLVEQLYSLVPNGIRIMSLNNEQRIARDDRRRHEKIVSILSSVMGSSSGNSYRRGLRIGGRGRNVPRHLFAELKDLKVEAGAYNFEIREGSRRAPRYKKYVAFFPHSESLSVMIKRQG